MKSTALAEVVASSLTMYTAHCWEWDTIPPFGSLVTCHYGSTIIYGLVVNIETGSTDTQRIPFPYKKTEAELRMQHPQIFQFLKTSFQACVLGFQSEGGAISYTTPPFPTKIHSFIHQATDQEVALFFSRPEFIPLLFSVHPQQGHIDEVILSLTHLLCAKGCMNGTLFERYYQTLALVIGNDYRRLKLLLQRINASNPQLAISNT